VPRRALPSWNTGAESKPLAHSPAVHRRCLLAYACNTRIPNTLTSPRRNGTRASAPEQSPPLLLPPELRSDGPLSASSATPLLRYRLTGSFCALESCSLRQSLVPTAAGLVSSGCNTAMHSLKSQRVSGLGLSINTASRPSAVVGARAARPQAPSRACPAARGDLLDASRAANRRASIKVASAGNGASSTASETVYIPVSELRELCTQSLAALGYSSDEIRTLNDVSFVLEVWWRAAAGWRGAWRAGGRRRPLRGTCCAASAAHIPERSTPAATQTNPRSSSTPSCAATTRASSRSPPAA